MDEKTIKPFSASWFLHNNIVPIFFTGIIALIGAANYLGNLSSKSDVATANVDNLRSTQNLLNEVISEKLNEVNLAQRCQTVLGIATDSAHRK